MKKRFILEGLECASCADKIERDIKKLDGVNDANVNFLTCKLIIDAENDKMPTIIKKAEEIVKKHEPDTRLKKA